MSRLLTEVALGRAWSSGRAWDMKPRCFHCNSELIGSESDFQMKCEEYYA